MNLNEYSMCPECRAENVQVRLDFGLYKHDQPNGQRCPINDCYDPEVVSIWVFRHLLAMNGLLTYENAGDQ